VTERDVRVVLAVSDELDNELYDALLLTEEGVRLGIFMIDYLFFCPSETCLNRI
jgi:hypothetical protein